MALEKPWATSDDKTPSLASGNAIVNEKLGDAGAIARNITLERPQLVSRQTTNVSIAAAPYGGTFCYVTGSDSASPFTHLAPVSATFHPLMAEMADADRLRGLPVHIVHGRLDWMFPVQVARQTSQALSAAGANVTYRELDDLSHTYPREMNAEILQWLRGDA